MLILVIGDLHIPFRSHAIPPSFRENLSSGKIFQVLCTGNLCTHAELDLLKTFCNDVRMVRGEFDEDDLCENESIQVNAGSFKIGVASAYTIIPANDKSRLAAKARELDVDILCFGGGHRAGVFEEDGRLFINPGSATGAFTSDSADLRPSFVLINIQGAQAVIFTYTLNEDGQFGVKKTGFKKDEE